MKRVSKVSLVKTDYNKIEKDISKVIELAGGLSINSGDKISIKINMCDCRSIETGAITHPIFLDALLKYLREYFKNLEIYVVEADSTVVLANEFIQWYGYMPIINKWNAKWINLSEDRLKEIEINGYYFKKLKIPSIINETYYINLSKLKTNSLSHITTCLKNTFGCLPNINKSIYHDNLAKVIADANIAMPSQFSIVDGIIGQGGNAGPAFGVPIKAGVVIAGRDSVAVARMCSKFMKIDPNKIKHIKLCRKAHVGTGKYELVGDKIEPIDFELGGMGLFEKRLALRVKNIQRKIFRSVH